MKRIVLITTVLVVVTIIAPTCPMLVKSVRLRFTRTELITLLRLGFIISPSLRNFTYALEQILSVGDAAVEALLAQDYLSLAQRLRDERALLTTASLQS